MECIQVIFATKLGVESPIDDVPVTSAIAHGFFRSNSIDTIDPPS